MNASPNWASLHQAIAELTSSGNAEIHESGEWLAELAAFRWEIRYEGKNPLLHLWSDERNLTRRVLDVKEQSDRRFMNPASGSPNSPPFAGKSATKAKIRCCISGPTSATSLAACLT